MSVNQLFLHLAKNSQDENAKRLKKMLQKGSTNNRIYSVDGKDRAIGFAPTYYTKPLIYAAEPYFCPNGWRRYGLHIGVDKQQFSKKYENWPVCYHGTSSSAAFSIISNGFRAQNNAACWISKEDKAVYLTPSIVYAGHPRYAKIQKFKDLYIQVVLQMRVKNGMFQKKAGTVQNTFVSTEVKVDQNYRNIELEWVFIWNKLRNVLAEDGILIYGIMVKLSNTNPRYKPENEWWEDSRERLGWDKYE